MGLMVLKQLNHTEETEYAGGGGPGTMVVCGKEQCHEQLTNLDLKS